ncbi:MAG TPA: ribose 5-phosphate isomerase B [bacterium]|nr:ribose 5-phosphate isomerase B [bacterium]
MKLLIASDHGGFALKSRIVAFLSKRKVHIEDLGTDSDGSVDYPDFAIKVAERVSQGHADAGVLVCGTGIGMCIVANKFRNVRAAVVSDPYSARMAKEHNNANILCVGGRVLEENGKAEEILAAWLDAQYQGGRHDRRLDKIRQIEKQNFK